MELKTINEFAELQTILAANQPASTTQVYIINQSKTFVSDPFHFDIDPQPAPNPTRENMNFCFTFFSTKKYISPKYDLFCYLWDKQKFNSFEFKMYDILMI